MVLKMDVDIDICQCRFPIIRVNYTRRTFTSMKFQRVKMSFNIGNQGAKQQYYLFNFQNQFKEQHIVIELHCVTLKNTCIVF